MARATKKKATSSRKQPVPTVDWTIQARLRPGRAELVKVPLKEGVEEEVLEVIRGPMLPKGKFHNLGIIGDPSGQVALAAFRLAVREAKRKAK